VDLAAGTVQAQAGNSATIANMESAAGGNGNDHLLGNSAANWLNGNLGNDTLDGREGNDTLVGGSSGEANVYVFSVAAGAANADLVQGFTSGQDRLQLAASAFPGIGAIGQLSAGDGRFYAAAGADAAHDADDRIVYNTSTGQLWYDAEGSGGGAAQLVATLQSEDFPAGVASLAATDIFVTGTANPPINGTAGNDTLAGTSNDDTINGLGGNDSIQGLGGGDSLTGGAGEDTIDGGTGPDTMVGGAGDDIYFVDNAADVIVEEENGGIDEAISSVSYGALAPWVNYLTLTGTAVQGLGNEVENRIVGNAASNFLQGYQGDDTLIGNGGNDSMWGYDDNDVLDGGDGNDSLVGGLGDDSISGGAGSDTMAYEAGDDTLDAGGGFDWLDFQHFASSAGIVADMRTGTVNADGTVSFMGVEGLQGTWSADRIIGDAGNDWLSGIGGADTLDAGLGNDTLTGGADADQFVFSAAPGAANADLITDFVSETDQIVLDASAMPGLGASGNFSAGDARFYAAAGATGGHDADDRVVYNTTTNQLFYDADGSGVATAQLIATLQGGVMPSATDIAVVNGSSTPPSGGSNLTGTTGPDTLIGTAGNDTIYGNSGNDWIEGRGGNDTVSGGSGQDSYVFREHGGANADFVTSFDTEWDMLRFDSGAFSALGGAGHFSSGDARFYSAAGASAGHDADDRVVYNTTTGQLYYDADGAGGADAQLVATIQGAAPVVASDIWVI
jgi:Ca2+-binding RTX toxin-like protein